MNMYIVVRRRFWVCAVLAFCLILCSCGSFQNAQQPGMGNETEAEAADKAPEAVQQEGYGTLLASQGIALPVSVPSVYADVTGYVTGREKKVVFAGDRHGRMFEVIRSQDHEVVYTGRILSSQRDVLSGALLSTGDFTPFDEPGVYYIRTDVGGQSYPFEIAADTYEKLFLNLLRNVSGAGMQETPEGVLDVSFGMHVMMYALQCNGSLFEAAYEHLDKSEQDRQLVTQLLYMGKWLCSRQQEDGSLYEDYEATAAFCGIMTMSRDMFGRYEAHVGEEYQKAVMAAWNWLEQQPCTTESAKNARFYAAVQLYRTEGDAAYRTIAETFLQEKKEDYTSEPFVFYGVLAYISAEKDTDRDLCTHMMQDIVDKVEADCEEIEQDYLFGVGTRSAEENMSHMLHLSFVNYLTPSKEYTAIIENTIQYMGGLNEHGICYVGADGVWSDIEAIQGHPFEWSGILLLGMSNMLGNFSEGI